MPYALKALHVKSSSHTRDPKRAEENGQSTGKQLNRRFLVSTRRPLSSSILWFIFRILGGNPKKELLRGLWVSRRFLVFKLPKNLKAESLNAKPQGLKGLGF